MFQFGSFEEAFARDAHLGEPPRELPRRKTLMQRIKFYAANAVVLPIFAVIYWTVAGEGLAEMLEVLSLRLYQLSVPGIGILRRYDGFNRITLASVTALLMFASTTVLWRRIFQELNGRGTVAAKRRQNPLLFYLLTGIASTILLMDAVVFYVGVSIKASTWTETPGYVPLGATVLLVASVALIGAFHADFSHPDNT